MQHYGQALTPPPTDFDVERELAKHYPHEASYEKMKAAQSGGSQGPTQAEQQQVQLEGALQSKRRRQDRLSLL